MINRQVIKHIIESYTGLTYLWPQNSCLAVARDLTVKLSGNVPPLSKYEKVDEEKAIKLSRKKHKVLADAYYKDFLKRYWKPTDERMDNNDIVIIGETDGGVISEYGTVYDDSKGRSLMCFTCDGALYHWTQYGLGRVVNDEYKVLYHLRIKPIKV